MYKIVFLNSGGKDSLTAMMLLKQGKLAKLGLNPDEPVEIHSLYVDMGWRNLERAKVAAQKLADKYCASHKVLSVGDWAKEFPSLKGGVRFQTLILHSFAMMYGSTIGAQFIASGVCYGPVDLDAFPVNYNKMHANFEFDFDRTLETFKWHKTRPMVICPFAYFGPRGGQNAIWEIVKHDPLWRETVSCNEAAPCKGCYKCQLRDTWLKLGAEQGF